MTSTGEKALQVHTKCVRKVFLRPTTTSEVKVVDDLVEIRKLLRGCYERFIRPEYVLMSPVEDGDVQMSDNWSVFTVRLTIPIIMVQEVSPVPSRLEILRKNGNQLCIKPIWGYRTRLLVL